MGSMVWGQRDWYGVKGIGMRSKGLQWGQRVKRYGVKRTDMISNVSVWDQRDWHGVKGTGMESQGLVWGQGDWCEVKGLVQGPKGLVWGQTVWQSREALSDDTTCKCNYAPIDSNLMSVNVSRRTCSSPHSPKRVSSYLFPPFTQTLCCLVVSMGERSLVRTTHCSVKLIQWDNPL